MILEASSEMKRLRYLSYLGWGVTLLAVLLVATPAAASVERYAVIVGNNQGAPHEGRLKYAEKDAQKVAQVLASLGDFRPENTVLLLGQGGSDLERVLIALNARIRTQAASQDSMLLVYYSGHADATALHMGVERVELSRLRGLVQGSAADFRVLLLDACRSGALTRVKGGEKTALFSISIDEHLAAEGMAVLTSSSANEDAQESDGIQGSFFTHYFVSGLRGAADRNGDGTVSVEEAYGYAHEHTIRESSQTLYGTQHPTFHLDLRGKGAVPLTWTTGSGQRSGRVEFPRGRSYLLFAGTKAGAVVAEVGAHDVRRHLVVDPGSYFVRGRATDHLLEGQIRVAVGETIVVSDDQLRRVEYARLARKGGMERAFAHGPAIGYQLRMPLWSEATPCHGPRAAYLLDLRTFSLGSSIGFCRSTFSNSTLHARADDLDLEVSATRVFDLPVVSLGLGLTGGGSWLHETFTTEGRAPPRNTLAGSAGAVVDLFWDLRAGLYVLTQVSGRVYVFEERRSGGEEDTTAKPVVRTFGGVGKRF